jgi:DNA-binding MarR family transcriptional regulator
MNSHVVISRDEDDRLVVTVTLTPETIAALAAAANHDGVLINLRTSGDELPPPLTRAVFRTEHRRKRKPVNRKLPFTQ